MLDNISGGIDFGRDKDLMIEENKILLERNKKL